MALDYCSSCKRPIFWAIVLPSHKTMPVDLYPSPGGNIAQLAGAMAGRHILCIVLTREQREAAAAEHGALFMSHFATCPNAAKHRKEV